MTKSLSKRQREKLAYIDEHAKKEQSICDSYLKDNPKELVSSAYMDGFDDGYKWYMNHPIGMLDEDYAWAIYAFINDWKMGKYGEVGLQKALADNFRY